MDNLTVFLLVVVAVITASLAFYVEWSDHKKAKAEFAKDVKFFAIHRKLDEKIFELLQYYEYLDSKNVVTEEDMGKLSALNREYDELKLEFDMKFKEFKSRQPKYS